jgi:hypothetical protein
VANTGLVFYIFYNLEKSTGKERGNEIERRSKFYVREQNFAHKFCKRVSLVVASPVIPHY